MIIISGWQEGDHKSCDRNKSQIYGLRGPFPPLLRLTRINKWITATFFKWLQNEQLPPQVQSHPSFYTESLSLFSWSCDEIVIKWGEGGQTKLRQMLHFFNNCISCYLMMLISQKCHLKTANECFWEGKQIQFPALTTTMIYCCIKVSWFLAPTGAQEVSLSVFFVGPLLHASQLNHKYYRVADKLAWSFFKTCDWLLASFLNADWFRKGSGELFAEAWYFWFNSVNQTVLDLKILRLICAWMSIWFEWIVDFLLERKIDPGLASSSKLNSSSPPPFT